MAKSISSSDDLIDSRDVIERISELESDLQTEHDTAVETMRDTDFAALPEAEHADYIVLEDFEEWLGVQADNDNDDAIELRSLRALLEEIEQNAGEAPKYGACLIRDSYFETYAQELAEDIGAIDRNASWPNTFIDWEAAAEALQADYSSIEFDGETYWVRS